MEADRGIRGDIQALRALAVVAVVIGHYWPAALPGGFVGVDVFFAISGYLITAQLLREVGRTGTVRLASFWARRARRILPAALLTLATCAVVTIAFVDLTNWPEFLREIRSAAGYVENWQLATRATDYFSAGQARSPVQHFWSLSVEEQFYLAWPVLIVAAAALSTRRATIAAALAGVTAASFVVSIHQTAVNPEAAYFVTPTRAWEFGLGGLLALAPACTAPARARGALHWLGVAAIMVAAVGFDHETAVPGVAVALPVVGAAAAMWARTATRLAQARAVQALGGLSYSIYLWHWPTLILAPYVLGHELGSGERVLLAGVALALAWLTKVLVEDPVRYRSALVHRQPRWTFATVLAATGAVLGLAGAASSYEHGQLAQAQAVTRATLAAKPRCFGAAARDARRPCRNVGLATTVVPSPLEAPRLSNGPCRELDFEIAGKRVCGLGAAPQTSSNTVALIGDSHSTHWRAALDIVGRARNWRVIHIGHTSCPLSMAVRPLPEPDFSSCLRWKRAVYRWLARNDRVETVFVSELSGGSGVRPSGGRSAFETAVAGYRDAWSALPKTVRRVIVIRDNPRTSSATPECIRRATAERQSPGRHCSLPRAQWLDPDPAVVAARRMRSARVRVIDLTRFFCDRRRCFPVIGGALVHQDPTHMTAIFNATLAPYLLRAVNRIVAPQR